jgi:hypothetical protein
VVDSSAERAALSRLRVAANLSGGTQVREMAAGVQSGFMGWWFGLKLWHLKTRVADAVLSIRDAGGGVIRAIEDFMQQTDIDVARFSIVNGERDDAIIESEARATSGLWVFQGYREQRDLLTLGRSAEGFLARLGSKTRRNIRKSAREADRIGLSFTFRERSRPLEIDEALKGLAARNHPAPVALGNLALFEEMLSHRPSSFESRVTAPDGALISLCRGFVQGATAYLVHQMNDPAIPGINLGQLHDFKLIEQLTLRGVTELIFVMNTHGFKRACRVSTKDELITIRPGVRGFAVAALLAVTLKGTRFGDGVGVVLKAILRHWFGLPKAAFDNAVHTLTPPGKAWARGVAAAVGVSVSLAAVGVSIMFREGLGFLSYITAYPAFLVATYLAGAWTGLLTIALGGLGILYYVIPPYDSFLLERSGDMWATAIYMISALILWRWFARRARMLQSV